ncbi:hypothetical protein FHW36_106439 [Chitinophaga polysaccharea]|uniref:Uncharacterized protein n=1 Tax=Chitinophaga polysaccharea TaxID=1293035 RepID=A0A561PM65_9BACT|nr:hypothetical protein FHW36_106439 [Chitinophaga polysaccharea]
MRSLNLKRIQSFATFDLPVNYNYIYTKFRKTHENYGSSYAVWPTAATRHKLISGYWENALRHYLLLPDLNPKALIKKRKPATSAGFLWSCSDMS